MKTITILLTGFLCCHGSIAQQNSSCVFERLFNLKEGLTKQAVIDSAKNIYGLEPFNNYNKSIETGSLLNNTSVKEQLIYKISDPGCLNGNKRIIRFDFINDKLEKAYLEIDFARADYYQMIDNFNFLRSIIKPVYAHEKEIKISSGNLAGNGYIFSKNKNGNAEKISLRYVNTKPDHGYGIYLLQVIWININNAGVETIMY